MDYEDRFYNGEPVECVTFEERGFIYGPIRLSYRPLSPIYSRFVEPASRPDFVRDKIAIFLIRDPRNILVSSYYSFGYTHNLRSVREIQEQQRQTREFVRTKTIDSFALELASPWVNYFHITDELSRACKGGVILRYEDMINDWDKFASGLTTCLDLSPKVVRQTYRRSRLRKKEDTASHRRSGKPGGYKDKLERSTIDALNVAFAPILARFIMNHDRARSRAAIGSLYLNLKEMAS